ncbi:TraY domain-containing protein [Lelliottia nimipressuralis]|uniref:Relaxosome protein TraY n=1 Tax=Lelliottia nimipressuralis TaxID=69220 RepID=A0ABD4KEP7_9ENTR|nr:TraY domain-containing protein [Lelliottia nimipressuralis]MBF4180392.1 TraY domain-containing protein [Lelliottia nimipressuralis]
MRRLTVCENKKRGMVLRIYVDHETLERLKVSASKAKRSKEREASARIDHHLSIVDVLPPGF